MGERPLKVSFRRAIVGSNLKDWLEVVSMVLTVRLIEQKDNFLWKAPLEWVFFG